MDQSAPPAFIIALFPVAFAAMWCGVCFLLSLVGGWQRLANRFTATDQPCGTKFTMQSGKVGLVSYNHCLTIHCAPNGLYLSVMFLIRVGHPPLFIPWEEIHNATPHRFLWFEWVAFEVGSPKLAKLQLSKKIFDGQNIF